MLPIMKRLYIASRGDPKQLANLFAQELPGQEILVMQPAPGDASVNGAHGGQGNGLKRPPLGAWRNAAAYGG